MPSAQPTHLVGSKSNGIVVSDHLLLHGKLKPTQSSPENQNGFHPASCSTMTDTQERNGTTFSADVSFERGDQQEPSTMMSDPTINGSASNNRHFSSPRPLKRSSTLYSSYDQTMYLNASKVFSALQHEPRDDGSYEAAQRRKAYKNLDKTVPFLLFESDNERKLTYELAYETLKYQYVLEDLLEDMVFFIKYPELINDLCLVTVVFGDYLQRKFASRELHPGEITYPEVTEVEECIVESKVKMDAALARRRIKECARSVEDLLPSGLKAKERHSSNLLTYAWINFHKTSLNYVLSELSRSGYNEVSGAGEALIGTDFTMDPLLDDTLIFSPRQALDLSNHKLIQEGCLIIQDRSSLLGPQSVLPLLNSQNEDVLIIDYNSGATSAHLSSLMKLSRRSGHVYLFGLRSPEHKNEIEANLDRLDAKNVKVMDEAFDSLEYDDVRLRNVKVVLIYAQCSKSAVLDPVSFVITEGEDITVLKDLSLGKTTSEKVNEMTRRNLAAFKHSSRLPKVQAVVYVTRSVTDTENEKIVMKVIESYNGDDSRRKHPYRVAPPTLKLDSKMAAEKGSDKYYRQSPSEHSNGCFIAVITKEVEHSKEGNQSILQRAAASGLLNDSGPLGDGEMVEEIKPKVKTKKSKSRNKKSSASSSSSKRKIRKPSSTKRVIAFGSSSSTVLKPRPRDTL